MRINTYRAPLYYHAYDKPICYPNFDGAEDAAQVFAMAQKYFSTMKNPEKYDITHIMVYVSGKGYMITDETFEEFIEAYNQNFILKYVVYFRADEKFWETKQWKDLVKNYSQ